MERRGLGPPASSLRATARRGAALVLVAALVGACGGKRKAAGGDAGAAAPARTARALDEAGLAALAGVELAGHPIEVVRRGPDFGAIVHAPAAGNVAATVTISACVTCTPLELARWEAERPTLTTLLAPGSSDHLAIERTDKRGWPLVEVRARRTIEGAPQVVVLALWNDGVTQLIASCEQPGAVEAEDLCVLLVEACALAYLPVLAPAAPP
jgi:hypothetical protein